MILLLAVLSRDKDHALTKPAEIIAPRLRYEDVNPQSLAFMLATGHQRNVAAD